MYGYSSKDTMELGTTPCGEDCVQVNSKEDYEPAMRKECERYMEMLEKRFPIPEDIGCYFKIKWFPHDFGRYAEVCISYDTEIQKESEFALFVEGNLPEKWNETEVKEFVYVPYVEEEV